MNRIPVVLSIDDLEYILDQLPPPSSDEEPHVTRLRQHLQEALTEVKKGAE